MTTIPKCLDDSDYADYMDNLMDFTTNHEWEAQRIADLIASMEDNSPIELHEAKSAEEAEIIIIKGCHINQQTRITLNTPLLSACIQKRNDVVLCLLKNGSDVNLANKYGQSPLHIAVLTNNGKVLTALLDLGANPYAINILGETLLHSSVQMNHTNTFLPLLLKYTDNDHINKLDVKGRSALRVASARKPCDSWAEEYDPLQNVQQLINAGADINLQCKRGLSALHVATYGEYTSVVVHLLHSGADVHARTGEDGHTALHIVSASEDGTVEMVRILIEAGSLLNTIDNHGNSILHSVKRNDILKYVLTNSMEQQENIYDSLKQEDVQGTSSAGGHLNNEGHIGSISGRRDSSTSSAGGHLNNDDHIGTLTRRRDSSNDEEMDIDDHESPPIDSPPYHDYIDDETEQHTILEAINYKNTDGDTPLHILVTRAEGLHMIQAMVDAKADIYAINDFGQSCLHTCALGYYNSRLNTIQKLVEIGVDVRLQDIEGNTALTYIPESDTASYDYLNEVIDNCTTKTQFKRANMNTINDAEDRNDFDMDLNETDNNY
jgi:ankyrin repeat protein